jgi:hypothetical protein
MGLESATYVSDLVSSNPLAGDNASQGDDHLRLVKAVLQTTLPNASRIFRFMTTEAVTAGDYTAVEADDMHQLIPINATAAARTVNLPSMTIDGWWAIVFKTDSSSNAVTIDPNGAGTINGATTITLTVQYEAMLIWWDNGASTWRGMRWFPTKPYYAGAQDIPFSDIAPSADAKRILAATTATDWSGHTVAAVLEFVSASLARGDLLMRGATAFDRLAPGTSGYFLQSAGAAADLVWALPEVPERGYAEYATNTTISAQIPLDDTIPQVGEGTEILSVSITPRRANSWIRARFQGFCTANGSANISAAMFLDGAANAIGATTVRPSTTEIECALTLEQEFATGTTDALTVSIRVGRAAAGTVSFNGTSAARRFGGVAAATLVVEEVFVNA